MSVETREVTRRITVKFVQAKPHNALHVLRCVPLRVLACNLALKTACTHALDAAVRKRAHAEAKLIMACMLWALGWSASACIAKKSRTASSCIASSAF